MDPIHTYMTDSDMIHPDSQDCDQLLIPQMLCGILFIGGGTYTLMSIPNDRFLRNCGQANGLAGCINFFYILYDIDGK